MLAPDTRLADERGMALLVALMAILLVMALGTALVLAASVESAITRNFRNSSEALYAADAGARAGSRRFERDRRLECRLVRCGLVCVCGWYADRSP